MPVCHSFIENKNTSYTYSDWGVAAIEKDMYHRFPATLTEAHYKDRPCKSR